MTARYATLTEMSEQPQLFFVVQNLQPVLMYVDAAANKSFWQLSTSAATLFLLFWQIITFLLGVFIHNLQKLLT